MRVSCGGCGCGCERVVGEVNENNREVKRGEVDEEVDIVLSAYHAWTIMK